jgi:hypothetical protein
VRNAKKKKTQQMQSLCAFVCVFDLLIIQCCGELENHKQKTQQSEETKFCWRDKQERKG